MSKPTKRDCAGCRDDFYNHNRMGLNEAGGAPECWAFKDAKFASAKDVPISMPPPYTSLPAYQAARVLSQVWLRARIG
jgi:hypothetical protein